MILPRLCEYDLGELEGLSVPEMLHPPALPLGRSTRGTCLRPEARA
ncbi:hypothetical protein HNQ09_003527 [Deinococcus budaensis]|uniref:Uncharacterized protein n=1 Tax=Deinococcus budaensis TaxID=1665626 RepID=A0A7W8LRQ2_9DEIO|nr:hypothetical protein [Deinococcus budaensis]